MKKSTIATILLTAGGLAGLAPSIATGEAQSGLNIGDNDSVFVDGQTFQVIPGKAKGDAAAQIKSLSARDLGPAAIIFRSGNKLYIADAQSETAGAQAQAAVTGPTNYAYDPRAYSPAVLGGGSVGYNHQVATDYAYDPRAYNPRLGGGGSSGYNNQVATDYAYDPRAYPIRNPNPWANDYAYDPHLTAQPTLIYDPDYVEYRLKKAFADNWTPAGTPTSTK